MSGLPLPLPLPLAEEGESPLQSPMVTGAAGAMGGMASPLMAAPPQQQQQQQPQSSLPFGRQPRAPHSSFARSPWGQTMPAHPYQPQEQKTVGDSDSEVQERDMQMRMQMNAGGPGGAAAYSSEESPGSVSSRSTVFSHQQPHVQAAGAQGAPRNGFPPFRSMQQPMQTTQSPQQQQTGHQPLRPAAAGGYPTRSPNLSSGGFAGAQSARPTYSYAQAQQRSAAPGGQQRQQTFFGQQQQQPQQAQQPRFTPARAMHPQSSMPPPPPRISPMMQARAQTRPHQQGVQRQFASTAMRGAAPAGPVMAAQGRGAAPGAMPSIGGGVPSGAVVPAAAKPEGGIFTLSSQEALESIGTPRSISGFVVPFIEEQTKLKQEKAYRAKTIAKLRHQKRHFKLQLKHVQTRAAKVKMLNLAVDAYESQFPPSCESLDAEDLEKRLGELQKQLQERFNRANSDDQRDQLQAELVEQERALRRSIHDERIRKVKLESVRRSLLDKNTLAKRKEQAIKKMTDAAPPQSEEEKAVVASLLETDADAAADAEGDGDADAKAPVVFADQIDGASYEYLNELAQSLRLISTDGGASTADTTSELHDWSSELVNWTGAANCEPPLDMISVFDMETMRVEGTHRALLLTQSQLSKRFFSDGGEAADAAEAMDMSADDEHKDIADLSQAMRRLAAISELTDRSAPADVQGQEKRPHAAMDEMTQQFDASMAQLTVLIQVEERQAREDDSDIVDTTDSVEAGQKAIASIEADIDKNEKLAEALCKQIRDILDELHQDEMAEREFEEKEPLLQEQYERDQQEIKEAQELFPDYHTTAAEVRSLQAKLERLSAAGQELSSKEEQLSNQQTSLQEQCEQLQAELTAAQQHRQEQEAAIAAENNRKKQLSDAITKVAFDAARIIVEVHQFFSHELPKLREDGLKQVIADTKTDIEMQGVEQTKAEYAAKLAELRSKLAGLKHDLEVVPDKLSRLQQARADLESFEQQRAEKLEMLECEDVALVDVQSMLDHIAQADEAEAREREQRLKEQAEREEQDRRDEEAAAEEERERERERKRAVANAKAEAKRERERREAEERQQREEREAREQAEALKAKAKADADAKAKVEADAAAAAAQKKAAQKAPAGRKRAAPVAAASTAPKRPRHFDQLYGSGGDATEDDGSSVDGAEEEQQAGGAQMLAELQARAQALIEKATPIKVEMRRLHEKYKQLPKHPGSKQQKQAEQLMAGVKRMDAQLQQLKAEYDSIKARITVMQTKTTPSAGGAAARAAAATTAAAPSASAARKPTQSGAAKQSAAKPTAAAKPAASKATVAQSRQSAAAKSAPAARPTARPAGHVQAPRPTASVQMKRPRPPSPSSEEESEDEEEDSEASSESEWEERKKAPAKKREPQPTKRPRVDGGAAAAQEKKKAPSRTSSTAHAALTRTLSTGRAAPASLTQPGVRAATSKPRAPAAPRAAPPTSRPLSGTSRPPAVSIPKQKFQRPPTLAHLAPASAQPRVRASVEDDSDDDPFDMENFLHSLLQQQKPQSTTKSSTKKSKTSATRR